MRLFVQSTNSERSAVAGTTGSTIILFVFISIFLSITWTLVRLNSEVQGSSCMLLSPNAPGGDVGKEASGNLGVCKLPTTSL